MASQLSELLIKINADAKSATKAFDDIKDQTEDLESQLGDVAKISAIAFAALSAEVFLSVQAFHEAEQASKQLNLALQNQGIFTEKLADQYKEYAVAVQEATGLDDDAIIKSQAIAQSFLGQTEITKELTFAIADLAEKQGIDLDSAATKIARTIGTTTNAFAREGLVISETASTAERYAQVLDFVNAKSAGFAAAANEGVGGIRGLQTAIGNFQEQIGSRFAPIISVAIEKLTALFKFFADNEAIADWTVALIAGGAAVAALGIAIPAVVTAFVTLKAVAAAAGVAINVAFVGIPLLIGAVVAGIVLLAQNWGNNLAIIKAATIGFLTFMSESFSGLGNILKGAFTFDLESIKRGISQITSSIKEGANAFKVIKQEETQVVATEEKKQDDIKKAAADKEAADKRLQAQRILDLERAKNQLIKLEIESASAELIALKKNEIEVLKGLTEQNTASEIELLIQRRDQIRALAEETRAEDEAQKIAYQEAQTQAEQEFAQQGIQARFDLRAQERAALQNEVVTDLAAQRKVGAEKLKAQIEEQNLRRIETVKHGAAMATINAALRSDEVQGAKLLGSELVGLAQSKNATLKAIGKAAAISQITIATAESAVTIAQQVQRVIPFPVNIPVIAALVGARIAFGAEQIGKVVSAQSGGLVEGGTPGRDSVPALLEPGELVVPRRNFNDVVGAVQGGGDNGAVVSALAELRDAIISRPTTVIQGDVSADESYIDALVRRISDAIEFRNAKIVGVNA